MGRISRRSFLQQGSLATATVAGTGPWGRSAWCSKSPGSALLSEFGYSDGLGGISSRSINREPYRHSNG
ncbi:twin-arginine translocation signal domain-containing protein [Edaphobacter paludis]|uniref:twin-arginine translocation signal domain-containing protein n=1 Tax=Edaphobacter paludis TaxID=3035702 RepID=UPI0035A14A5D